MIPQKEGTLKLIHPHFWIFSNWRKAAALFLTFFFPVAEEQEDVGNLADGRNSGFSNSRSSVLSPPPAYIQDHLKFLKIRWAKEKKIIGYFYVRVNKEKQWNRRTFGNIKRFQTPPPPHRAPQFAPNFL